MSEALQIITTNWAQHSPQLREIRTAVFIAEQHVPADLEWDEYDTQSIHFLALLNNQPIATARLKPDGQIGRMAVIKGHRHQGIGKKLLATVLLFAEKNDYRMVYLHAQKQAADFYKQFGFIYTGHEFTDAGILHQAMYQQLNNKT